MTSIDLEVEHEFNETVGPLELLVTVNYAPGRGPRVNCAPDDAEPGEPSDCDIVSVKVKPELIPWADWRKDDRFIEKVNEEADRVYEERGYERAYGEGY